MGNIHFALFFDGCTSLAFPTPLYDGLWEGFGGLMYDGCMSLAFPTSVGKIYFTVLFNGCVSFAFLTLMYDGLWVGFVDLMYDDCTSCRVVAGKYGSVTLFTSIGKVQVWIAVLKSGQCLIFETEGTG